MHLDGARPYPVTRAEVGCSILPELPILRDPVGELELGTRFRHPGDCTEGHWRVREIKRLFNNLSDALDDDFDVRSARELGLRVHRGSNFAAAIRWCWYSDHFTLPFLPGFFVALGGGLR